MRIVILALACAVLLLARSAPAEELDEEVRGLFDRGQAGENEGAFARALEDYRACVAAAPSSRWALRASDRIDWLHARSEGDFAPLARLEHVRRSAALADDPAQIESLARDAESFPPGLVRVEARMLVADAWLGRMHRTGDAIVELRRVVADPKADPLTARLAARELVEAVVGQGKIDEAAREASALSNRLDPRFATQVKRLVRRRAIERVAVAQLAVFATFAASAIGRAARRRNLHPAARALRSFAPLALAFSAFIGVAGGVLASRYESGSAMPFVLLAAVALPLVVVARAWAAVGATTAWSRGARASMCAASVLSAAFVVIDAIHPAYLEGFGL